MIFVKIIIFIICNLIFSYLGVTFLSCFFKYHKVMLDFSILFYNGNPAVFLIATFLGLLPFTVYLLDHSHFDEKDKDNYNRLMKTREAKRKYLKISFDENGIYETPLDKIQIFISEHTHNYNSKLKKITEKHRLLKWLKIFKLYERKSWMIGGKKTYFRAGLVMVSEPGKVWVDPTDSHSLILGTTNSGKTVSSILPLINMIRMCGESAVIIDMKGELSQLTYDAFKKDGYRILILDFIDPEFSDGWNPLSMAYKAYKEEKDRLDKLKKKLNERMKTEKENYISTYGTEEGFDMDIALGKDENGNPYCVNGELRFYPDFSKASEIVESVADAVTADPTSKEAFWNSNASDIMKGLIYLLLEEGKEANVNLASSKSLFDIGNLTAEEAAYPGEQTVSILKKYVKTNRSPSDLSFEKLSTYLDNAPETAQGMKTTFNERVNKILMSTQIKNILSINDIDLTDLDSQKTIIFVKIHDEKETYYPLVNIFMGQLQQYLIEQARKYPDSYLKYPFNFVWDEFPRFPKYKYIESLLGAGRSRGIRLQIALQGYDQLEAKYGKAVERSIKNGCMNKIYLLSDDEMTLKEISESVGHKQNKSHKGGEKKLILTPEALSKFQYGDTLVLRQREYPFKTRMLPNFKYKYYKKDFHIFEKKPHKVASVFDIAEALRISEGNKFN